MGVGVVMNAGTVHECTCPLPDCTGYEMRGVGHVRWVAGEPPEDEEEHPEYEHVGWRCVSCGTKTFTHAFCDDPTYYTPVYVQRERQ